MVSIQQIRYFVAAVEEGSLSAAAKTLRVSVQAVSKGLVEFEQHLQRDLFVRRSHGVEPTPLGHSLYVKAKMALVSFTEVEMYGLGSSPNEVRSDLTVVLCSPPFATRHVVQERISAYMKRMVDIEVRVGLGYLDSCINALVVGAADAIITIGATHMTGFDVLRVGSVPTGLLMMEDNELAAKKQVRLDDFAGRPIGLTPEFDFFYDTVIEGFARRRREVPLAKSALTMNDTYRVLAREQGCFIVPAIPELGELFPGSTIRPLVPEDSVTIPICLVSLHAQKSDAFCALERQMAQQLTALRDFRGLLRADDPESSVGGGSLIDVSQIDVCAVYPLGGWRSPRARGLHAFTPAEAPRSE